MFSRFSHDAPNLWERSNEVTNEDNLIQVLLCKDTWFKSAVRCDDRRFLLPQHERPGQSGVDKRDKLLPGITAT